MSAITITEICLPENNCLEKIHISGAKNKQHALSIVEEWCDENNCLFQEINFVTNDEIEVISSFTVKVLSDDYL